MVRETIEICLIELLSNLHLYYSLWNSFVVMCIVVSMRTEVIDDTKVSTHEYIARFI